MATRMGLAGITTDGAAHARKHRLGLCRVGLDAGIRG
jgi:hypothetical protein